MRLDTIRGADWQTFERDYPGAAAFLRRASIVGERESLAKELTGSVHPKRREWMEKRIADIDAVEAMR